LNTAFVPELFPDDVANRAALEDLGMSPASIWRRCLPGGPWRRLLPGVYLMCGGEPTRRHLARAALLRAGPDAVITGLEAARRYGVRKVPDDPRVHVLVPHDNRRASRDFVLVERTVRAPVVREVAGLPLAEPARALVDGARRLVRLDDIRAMIADAVQRGVCTDEQLAVEVANRGLGGAALPRRVMIEISEGVRSAAEAWARSLVQRAGLPTPTWNVAVSSSGRLLGVADGWWDDVALAWEIDSYEFHLSPADYARTMRKHSAFAAAGVYVVHTLPSRLRTEPRQVLEELKLAHAHASRRPRPDVRAELWRR
jgi:hypothetical protein